MRKFLMVLFFAVFCAFSFVGIVKAAEPSGTPAVSGRDNYVTMYKTQDYLPYGWVTLYERWDLQPRGGGGWNIISDYGWNCTPTTIGPIGPNTPQITAKIVIPANARIGAAYRVTKVYGGQTFRVVLNVS